MKHGTKLKPFHTTDELGVFWIPEDATIEAGYRTIPHDISHLQRLVGGYAEPIRLGNLKCGCSITLLVNELPLNRGINRRANVLYPHRPQLLGDCVLVSEGLVARGEIDFFSLPPSFNDWQGPGSPFPTA